MLKKLKTFFPEAEIEKIDNQYEITFETDHVEFDPDFFRFFRILSMGYSTDIINDRAGFLAYDSEVSVEMYIIVVML